MAKTINLKCYKDCPYLCTNNTSCGAPFSIELCAVFQQAMAEAKDDDIFADMEIESPYHRNPLDDDFEGDIDDYTFDIDPSELKI